jgi:hypothetical protein
MSNIQHRNEDGMSAIYQAISYAIDKKINESNYDKTYTGLVVENNLEDNTYSVMINGYKYQNINSMIQVNVGDSVMVMCPQNQLSQMFIYGKIDNNNYANNDAYSGNNIIINVGQKFNGQIASSSTIKLQLEPNSLYLLTLSSYTKSTNAFYGTTIHCITSHPENNGTPTDTAIFTSSNAPASFGVDINNRLTIQNANSARQAIFGIIKIA